ncbi:hypothetical protein BX598_1899 [Micrococcaceae bacterium JKS001869]|nr:hypothetical protein BX598_1899 [Micrococcaceae bacterium JKS001869]
MTTLYVNEAETLVGDGVASSQWVAAIGHAILDTIRKGKPCTISIDHGNSSMQRFYIPATAAVRLVGSEDGFVMTPAAQSLSAECAQALAAGQEPMVSLAAFRTRFGVTDNGL